MVICGQCEQKFDTSDAELAHVCPTTGVTPTDPLTMGSNYAAIQEAALARGAAEGGTSTTTTTTEPEVITFS